MEGAALHGGLGARGRSVVLLALRVGPRCRLKPCLHSPVQVVSAAHRFSTVFCRAVSLLK